MYCSSSDATLALTANQMRGSENVTSEDRMSRVHTLCHMYLRMSLEHIVSSQSQVGMRYVQVTCAHTCDIGYVLVTPDLHLQPLAGTSDYHISTPNVCMPTEVHTEVLNFVCL